jgi:hypothetical protein
MPEQLNGEEGTVEETSRFGFKRALMIDGNVREFSRHAGHRR